MSFMRTLSCGRRAPRKAVDLRCRVRVRGQRGRRLRVTELSTHGAWLETNRPWADGTLVELDVVVDGRARRLRGEVMWARQAGRRSGMAIEWLDLDAATRRGLADMLTAQPAAEGAPSRFAYADVV